MDHLVGQPVAELARSGAPPPSAATPPSSAPDPWRTARRRRRRSRPRRRRRTRPRPRARRRAAATGCRRTARGARRRRRRSRPAAPRANAIHSLRLGSRCGFGRTDGADGAPVDRVDDHVGDVGAGDHRAHARPRGDLRRGELARHPAAPARVPVPPATASSAASTSTISSISDASSSRRGIGGEQPGRVGEEHEHVGLHEVRHERGEPVVVAVADLVVGDGVVLVDDRDDAEVEQAAQGVAGVQVLRRARRSRAA